MDSVKKQQARAVFQKNPFKMAFTLFPKAFDRTYGIPWYFPYIFWALLTKDRTIVKLPRRHAKSTLVTFLYVMYCILFRKKKFILVVSSTGQQAVKFLARIRYYLVTKKVKLYFGSLDADIEVMDGVEGDYDADNFYVEAQGKKKSPVWNFKEVYIPAFGCRIMATSIKSANRGLLSIDDRPDLIILDDIEDKKNTNTADLRQSIKETIFEELIPAGKEDCQFIAIGTICHYGSYLLQINKSTAWYEIPIDRASISQKDLDEMNKDIPDRFKYKPNVEYFKNDTIGLDGVSYKKGDAAPEMSIWQERYSYEYYCKLLEEASAAGLRASFWQEYYNIPKDKSSRVFTEYKYIEGIHFENRYGTQVLVSDSGHKFPNGKTITNVWSFIGGDLAVSDREGADWRVFITVFADPFKNIYVLPPYKSKQPDPFPMGKQVLDWHQHYNYHAAKFDGQHFQKWFGNIIKHLQRHERHSSGAKYRHLTVYQEARTNNKEEVITAGLTRHWERVYFLGPKEKFEDLELELTRLGYVDHDDHADAIYYAISAVEFPAEIDFSRLSPVKPKVTVDPLDGIPLEKRWFLC